jgi:small subunit ribosomal protein S8
MAVTDPLGDLLTRIRNGQRARKDSVLSPASKLRVRVLDVLQREGYIRGYSEEELALGKGTFTKGVRIELKYFEGQPAIKHVARVSKPGRRIYSGATELPRVMNGLGITIVSTPRGVLSDAEAREQNVGGEVLAEVF